MLTSLHQCWFPSSNSLPSMLISLQELSAINGTDLLQKSTLMLTSLQQLIAINVDLCPAIMCYQCWFNFINSLPSMLIPSSCSVINVDFPELQLSTINVDFTSSTHCHQCWFPSSNSVPSMLTSLQQLSTINVDFPPATQCQSMSWFMSSNTMLI